MQDYQVGQILFLISDSSRVVPIQIIEEVIRTTLAGKEKTYIIMLPDKDRTTVDIKKIKGKLFTDKTELKTFMLSNAENAINQMISESDEISVNVFDSTTTKLIKAQVSSKEDLVPLPDEREENTQKVQQEDTSGIIKVDLGNGKYGKISTNELDNAGAPK